MGIRNDRTTSDLSEKVRAHKPAGLTDACWREPEALLSEAEHEPATDASRQRLEQPQSYRGSGECATLYRAFSTPRHVAGAPLANDVVACHLRSPYRSDYAVEFSEAEFAELSSIFSTGVCDWSRGDRSGASHQAYGSHSTFTGQSSLLNGLENRRSRSPTVGMPVCYCGALSSCLSSPSRSIRIRKN